jgi:xyloglucan fucosyltransferase
MSRQALELVPRSFKWAPPGVPSRYISAKAVTAAAFLSAAALILFTLGGRYASPSLDSLRSPNPKVHRERTFTLPASAPNFSTPDVAALIAALQRATAGRDATFSDEARQRWREQHPCRARGELQPLYTLRRLVEDAAPNANWERVFKEYETLHRVCTQSVGGDLVEYFASRGNGTSCRFLVAGIAPGAGLGNKMLSMASGLLYAILTQRVFLIAADTLVPGILCEPFEGSSWLFDPEWKVTPEYAPGRQQYWQNKDEFYTELDGAMQERQPVNSSIYGLVANDEWCQPGQRFFCSTEQSYYHLVPWVYINGCFYYLPKLFAIPAFRPVLEELFPDKLALTHLLRTAFLPSDEVWRRIDQIYSLYLRNADRRVGLQVRYRDGEKEFNSTRQLVSDRVVKCALENHLLPEPGAKGVSPLNQTLTPKPRYQTSVFIASLYPSLHDYLGETYTRNPPEMEDVSIIQVTRGKEQRFNDEEDKQALTEIISLSLADYLFVTPLSTFGGMAQGYGALVPWFIDNRPTSELACVRAQTVDVCYQVPKFIYNCPYEPELDKQWVLEKVPYLRDCLPVDARLGMQLITGN